MGSDATFFEFMDNYSPKLIRLEGSGPAKSPMSFFSLRHALRRRFNISDAMTDLLDVSPVRDPHGEETWAITVGCNYLGCLPDDLIAKISEELKKEEPSWWLDSVNWFWRPGPRA